MTDFWRDRRVFVTGHTGFKGSWLSLWLHRLGARVTGYALPPDTDPNLYQLARVGDHLTALEGDLRNLETLSAALAAARPSVVFHLAAQPLVGRSYRDPVDTWSSNVLGTVHLLEAVRHTPGVDAVVVVTSDKVYRNQAGDAPGAGWPWPYRETDALGGHDPYSASKACTELVAASYRSAFFAQGANTPRLATARAGNVIGGGDWAEDRLIPDIIRAWQHGQPVHLRAPGAVRPWQHVLEPLSGYLALAQALVQDSQMPAVAGHDDAWNFGPDEAAMIPVGDLVARLASHWGPDARWTRAEPGTGYHETLSLRVDSSKARQGLAWRPRWSLTEALAQTMAWYAAWHRGEDVARLTLAQIDAFAATTATASAPTQLPR